MRNILTIIKKELYTIFSSRSTIIFTFIFPGLSIYILYSIIGNNNIKEMENMSKHNSIVEVVNAPDDFVNVLPEAWDVSYDTDNDYVTMIENGDLDLVIEFPALFKNTVEHYLSKDVPVVNVYYNPSENYSLKTYEAIKPIMDSYSDYLLTERLGNKDMFSTFNIQELVTQDEQKSSAKALGQILPFLILIFMFQGAVGHGSSMFAGEKERGTISTLLVTPIKRKEMAYGKIISLAIIAILTSISSFIGILLTVSKVSQIKSQSTSVVSYGPVETILILAVILMTVLFYTAIISNISILSSKQREASQITGVLYIFILAMGASSMGTTAVSNNVFHYLLPLYNSVISLKSIFLLEYSLTNILVMIFSNVIYYIILVRLLEKFANNEKVMYSS